MYVTTPSSRSLRRTAWLGFATLALALAGCASKPPQGYGASEQSTAAQAQQQMEKAEQSAQADPQLTYANLIAQMQQANQWYASLAHTEAFERQYGSTPSIRLLRADALRNTGQPQQAEKEYRALLGTPDTNTQARARRGLGLLYAGQKQYAQAVSQLESARQLNPIDVDVLGDLAYANMLDGRLSAASLPILQAAELAPTNTRVQLNLALYWLASGDNAQADRLLQRLSKPQPKSTAPVIDDASLNTLQAQLLIARQAVQARVYVFAYSITPAVEIPAVQPLPAPRPNQIPSPASNTVRTIVISNEPVMQNTASSATNPQ